MEPGQSWPVPAWRPSPGCSRAGGSGPTLMGGTPAGGTAGTSRATVAEPLFTACTAAGRLISPPSCAGRRQPTSTYPRDARQPTDRISKAQRVRGM